MLALWGSMARGGTARSMKVEISHSIDASEPNASGFYEYHYEYDMFEFTDGITIFWVRSYNDEPEKAALMARDKRGKRGLLTKRDLRHPLLLEAVAYLRAAGKSELVWLDRKSQSYLPFISPIPR
jgi:hypothetical protein